MSDKQPGPQAAVRHGARLPGHPRGPRRPCQGARRPREDEANAGTPSPHRRALSVPPAPPAATERPRRAAQDGEVINKIEGYECENRRVLHTAMRDVFDAPNQVLKANAHPPPRPPRPSPGPRLHRDGEAVSASP